MSQPIQNETSSNPIKITHLLHTIGYGGIETVIINWLRSVDTSRLDIQLVTFKMPDDSEQPFVEAAERAGLSVSYIPWSRSKPIFKAKRELVKLLNAHGSSIVHTHNVYADIVGYMAGRQLKIKKVSTIYVWEDADFGFKRNMLQKIGAFTVKHFDLLTAQCQKTVDESRSWGFDTSTIKILPSGYDVPPPSEISVEQRSAFRAERGANQDSIIACNVARMYPEKSQAFLLEVWQRIAEHYPQARLWIYGVGPLEDELKQLAKKLKIESSVSFVGFASDLSLEMDLCDIQLHPSLNEGIPIAICAGMSSGLPIVATAVGGIPEVIRSEENGILIDVDDADALFESTARLIESSELRTKLGDEAQRFIRERYSLEAATTVLDTVYRELLQKS